MRIKCLFGRIIATCWDSGFFIALIVLINLSACNQPGNIEKVKTYVEELSLTEVKRGVFVRETYRSKRNISLDSVRDNQLGTRSSITLAYYLITSEALDHFHRLRSDEIWNYRDGGRVKITMIHPNGVADEVTLDLDRPHYVVPANTWYYAETSDYVLVTLAVAPGFDPQDFEDAHADSLRKQFPQHMDIIAQGFK